MLDMLMKFILIATFLFTAHVTALACDCPHPPTVLKAFHNAGSVMLVRLESAAEWPSEQKAAFHRGLNFVVEKVYKGAMKPGDSGVLANGNYLGDGRYSHNGCERTFKREDTGKKLLIYNGEAKPAGSDWTVSECGRTAFLPEAAADIKWLESTPIFRGLSRLSGRIVIDTRDPATGQYSLKGAANVKVKIEGDYTEGKKRKTISVRTDADGVYEAYGLVPGIYSVIISLPKRTEVSRSWIYGDLDPRVEHSAEELDEVKSMQSMMDGFVEDLKKAGVFDAGGIRFIQVTRGGHSVVDFYLKEKR
jgi:hypothetical protein